MSFRCFSYSFVFVFFVVVVASPVSDRDVESTALPYTDGPIQVTLHSDSDPDDHSSGLSSAADAALAAAEAALAALDAAIFAIAGVEEKKTLDRRKSSSGDSVVPLVTDELIESEKPSESTATTLLGTEVSAEMAASAKMEELASSVKIEPAVSTQTTVSTQTAESTSNPKDEWDWRIRCDNPKSGGRFKNESECKTELPEYRKVDVTCRCENFPWIYHLRCRDFENHFASKNACELAMVSLYCSEGRCIIRNESH